MSDIHCPGCDGSMDVGVIGARDRCIGAELDDLKARIHTNLRVYQRRVENETATEFDCGKRAAFQVVLSMLEPRGTPSFSCGRHTHIVSEQNPWLATSDIEADDRR